MGVLNAFYLVITLKSIKVKQDINVTKLIKTRFR